MSEAFGKTEGVLNAVFPKFHGAADRKQSTLQNKPGANVEECERCEVIQLADREMQTLGTLSLTC